MERTSQTNELTAAAVFTPRARRVATFFEALGFAGFLAVYIWRLQLSERGMWWLLLLWLATSLAIHRDSPKTVGWRADNLWKATRRSAPVFLAFSVALLATGALMGGLHRPPIHLMPGRFYGYLAFCLLQQVGLNSFLTNRFLDATKSPAYAAILAGSVFAALHWPNPVLVPLTLVGGMAMAWLFATERNILPLALGQAVLGALVSWAFPAGWHHFMRVGPGFYTFPH